MKKLIISLVAAVAVTVAGAALAENQISTLRGSADLGANEKAPTIPPVVNSDLRKVRNYPEQPPLIPHKIDGYQVDRNVNRCLQCHQRSAIEVTQAPMVSVTHFMGRDNQVLAQVSPRRYFCTQCHVTQVEARPLLKNTFIDGDTLIEFLKSQPENKQ